MSVRWAVGRGVAAVYALALVSFAVPLIGSRGIAPAAEWLAAAHARYHFYDTPTLLWWNASAIAILGLCALGIAAACAAGAWPRVALAACWICYLFALTDRHRVREVLDR